MPDLILSLIISGSPDHPRFLVAHPDSKFWTGEDWSNEKSKALLFATVNGAARAIQEIQLAEYGDKPLRRYIAPVHVDLYSDNDFTPDEIGDWLVKVARLTIDAEKHGNGPAEGTLGLMQIDWSQLREIED